MKYIIFKKYCSLLSFIFLAQTMAFANTSDSIQKDQESFLDPLVQNQIAVIREYNAEVQNLLISIPQTKSDEERSVEAQRLTLLMRDPAAGTFFWAVHTLEAIAERKTIPTNTRISAIRALSENTIPNYNMNDIIFEEAVPPLEIMRAVAKGRDQLKTNYTQTKRRFSKLYHFIHLDPSIREAWAATWINITIHNPNINIHEKLLYLLSSNEITTQQMALLIAEKLKNEYFMRFDPIIRRRINGIRSSIKTSEDSLGLQYSQNPQRRAHSHTETQSPLPAAVSTPCPSTFSNL